jgi:hypothetical protein
MPHLLIVLLAVTTAALADTAAFELRAHAVDQRLQAAQAAGVPSEQLQPARHELAAQRERRSGPIPYAVVSGAAVADPFQAAEASLGAAYRSAHASSRERAEATLERLRDASGPGADAAYEAGIVQLARAATPAELNELARRWNAQADALDVARQRLATTAGGLDHGLPADVVGTTAHLRDLVGRADRSGVGTTDAVGAVARAQQYLAHGYPELLSRHDRALADVRAAADALQHRLDLRQRAADLLSKIPALLDQATQYGAGDDFKGRVDQARAGLDGARASGDDGRLDAALAGLEKLNGDLEAAASGRLPTSGVPCQAGAPDQLIVIHLTSQQLVAYDMGCPILRTPVTTGRPALPTGRGTFRIFYKAPAYHMVSPWPPGNPFYYPPTWVSDAMEFIGNGTFMHSADWQPDSTYGPGSEYGPYASHGCVHVIGGPLQQLYDWAAIGATVVVED